MYLWTFTHATVRVRTTWGHVVQPSLTKDPRGYTQVVLLGSKHISRWVILPALQCILKTRSTTTEFELDILCVGHVKPWFKCGLWTEEAKRTVPQESPGGWLGRSDESAERRGSTEGEFGRKLIHMTLKFLFNPDMQWLCVCVRKLKSQSKLSFPRDTDIW